MTSEHGEAVLLWVQPTGAHLQAALEPLLQIADTRSAELDGPGDGAEYARAESVFRFFYSIPAAVAWWMLFVCPLVLGKLLRAAETEGLSRRGQLILGGLGFISLLAAVLKGLDYYREATTYAGYFHLEIGAYALILAYSLLSLAFTVFSIKLGRFLRAHAKS